jgi:[ribosomal protein S18]-alanine N-acetyltransferase
VPEPILRDFESADFGALCLIDRACFAPGIAYSRRMMSDLLEMPHAACLVADAAGSICGFIITLADTRQGHIITLDVLPEYRRAKIGSKILAAAEARLAARGIRMIHLEAAVENAPAVAFWRKHGYCEERILKDYYRHGQDAWSMTKRLPTRKES